MDCAMIHKGDCEKTSEACPSILVDVLGVAGDTLAHLCLPQHSTGRTVKDHVAHLLSLPRFRLRLLVGAETLDDQRALEAVPNEEPLTLTLVRLPLQPLEPLGEELLRAVTVEDTSAAEAALQRCADPNHVNALSGSSLKCAVDAGNVELARLLIEAGANANLGGVTGCETPMHAASWSGHLEAVQVLLEANADLHLRDTEGKAPIHGAAWRGHADVVRLLCEHGSNNQGVMDDGKTPLHMASWQGHLEVSRYLCTVGAPVSARTGDGRTPLHMAAWQGHKHLAACLCEHGALAGAANEAGETPLHFAAWKGHTDIVQQFCIMGVGQQQAEDGKAPMHMAAWNGHLEVMRLLCSAGGGKNEAARDGKTCLHMAAWNGHIEVVRFLIDAGVPVDPKDQEERTPLHMASWNGHTAVADFLCRAGADVDAAMPEDGKTPLHMAAWSGHEEVAHVLIESGADMTKRAMHHGTPVAMAKSRRHWQLATQLKRWGAIASRNVTRAHDGRIDESSGRLSFGPSLGGRHCNREDQAALLDAKSSQLAVERDLDFMELPSSSSSGSTDSHEDCLRARPGKRPGWPRCRDLPFPDDWGLDESPVKALHRTRLHRTRPGASGGA